MEIKKSTTITPIYTIGGDFWEVVSIYGSALSGDIDMLTVIKEDMEANGLHVEMKDLDDDVTILKGDYYQEVIENGILKHVFYFREINSAIEFVREDKIWKLINNN